MSLRFAPTPSMTLLPVILITLATVMFDDRYMLIRVREDSMSPTLVDGQWVVVRRGVDGISRGDIVVFSNPLDHDLSVKRYVLGSGDRPTVTHGWLETPWGRWFLSGRQWELLEDGGPVIPDGLYYLVGDNQFRSLDSRTYGPVTASCVVGRVVIRSSHD